MTPYYVIWRCSYISPELKRCCADSTERAIPRFINATNNVNDNSDNRASYTIHWEHDDGATFFEVSACDPLQQCERCNVTSNKRSVTFMLTYSTKYSIRISAEYVLPLSQFRRTQAVGQITTLTGKSDRVENLKVKQVGCSHTVSVRWERPRISRDRLEWYKIEMNVNGEVPYFE